MRHFLFKILLFCILILAIDVLILSLLDKQSYLKAIRLKHNLLEKAGSEKIVFVGGSNLSFGLDSTKIFEAFKRNTVNMGLYGNFGLLFMLNEVKDDVKKRDVIIVIPEYRNFFNQNIYGKEDMAEAIFVYPVAIKYLTTTKHWKNFMTGSVSVLQRKIQARMELLFRQKKSWESAREKLYSIKNFNNFGDMTGHWRSGPGKGQGSKFFFKKNQFNPDSIDILNKFNKFVLRKGGLVLFAYPVIPDTIFRKNYKTLIFLHKKLSSELEFPIISPPERYVLPHQGNFFDTVYHLSRRGIKRRMSLLIEDLRPFIKN